MSTSLSRASALGLVIWASSWGLCPGAEPEAPDSLPVHQVLVDRSPTLLLDYFKRLAAAMPPERQVPQTRREWEERREELRQLLWGSLGTFPLENRPSLEARVTGRLDHGDHVVEKIVYQSLPGL